MIRIARSSSTAAIIAAVVMVGLTALAPSARAAGSGVPFKDSYAHGYIALCDLAGHNVTSGSTTTAPFAWKAVSSAPQPAGYRGKGQNAALTIYQARKGVDPLDWNGDQLTAASFFPVGGRPAAAATYKDISLATIIREFPPTWDGLYELRMAFAKSGYGDATSTRYPAAVIQVTGTTWHLVQGGTLPCSSTKVTSTETFTGIKTVNPKHTSKAETPTSAPVSQQAGPSSGSAGSGASHVISTSLRGDSTSVSSGSDSTAIVIGTVAGVVIVLIAAGLVWRRRQGSVTS